MSDELSNDIMLFICFLAAWGQWDRLTLNNMPFKTDIMNMLAQLDIMLYSLQIQSNSIIHLKLCYWLTDDIPSQFISVWNGIFGIMFSLKLTTIMFPLP